MGKSSSGALGPRDRNSLARFEVRAEHAALSPGLVLEPGNVTKCHTSSKNSLEKYKQS